MDISGGVVTATGDTAEEYCYGIYASCNVIPISGGHVIARTPDSKSATYQAALVTPDLNDYTGYYWRTSSSDSFTSSADTEYSHDNSYTYVEFSSKSTVTTYTVTFDPNGGELIAASNPSTETEPDGTVDYLNAATREGYTFDGWYTEKTSGEKVHTYITVFTADTTVYAHWTPVEQTKQITEASFAMKGYTVGANAEDIVITSNTDSLSLIGGYYESIGKPFSYIIGTDIDEKGEPQSIVTGPLEAGKEYILMLKADVAAGYDGSVLTAGHVTLNGIIKATYCSDNMYTTIGCGFMLPVLTENGTTDVKYTVTVIGSNASVTGAGKYEAGETVTLADGSIINFIFSGWTSDDGIISDVYSADTSFVMPAKDVTVTANWIYNGFIIIPGGDSSDGSDSSGGSTTPTYPPVVEQPKEGGSVDTSTDNHIAGDNVTITPTPDEGYEVDEVIVTDQNGNPVEITDNGDGTYSFTQPEDTVTVTVTFKEKVQFSFTDVPDDTYYCDAVYWAVENDITFGTGDGTTFSPDEPCTRAQIVTFLWRASRCPTPKSTEMSFTDVVKGSYYETAVLWAVENGITLGTNAEGTMFSPDAVCSRAQIVTFLYRGLGD